MAAKAVDTVRREEKKTFLINREGFSCESHDGHFAVSPDLLLHCVVPALCCHLGWRKEGLLSAWLSKQTAVEETCDSSL